MSEQSNAAQIVIPGVPFLLSYLLPEKHSAAGVGSEVTVELGSRAATGYVVERLSAEAALAAINGKSTPTENSTAQLSFFAPADIAPRQQLKSILSARPAFHPEQLQLFQWMADYYGVSLGEVIESSLPKRSTGRDQNLVRGTAALPEFMNSGESVEKLRRKAQTQADILQIVAAHPEGLSANALPPFATSLQPALRSLEKKGLITLTKQSVAEIGLERSLVDPGGSPLFTGTMPESLTAGQEAALSALLPAIASKSFSPFLLYGITGSGKTEVYLRAIQSTLAQGRSALVIVPEIALTPQLLDQFRSRLQIPLGLLHSQVGQSERWATWEALLEGKIRVAIGARSAIFAPAQNLGLVIVDEEHETSYKQSDSVRYHGRDVAVMRAKLAGCPLILGSATPSFESLLNASRSRYQLLELPCRVSTRKLPAIEIIDLNKIKRSEMASENVSPELYSAMRETLEKKGQIIILYNRRGFSSYLQCDSCSEAVLCPNCSVTLTFHKRKNKLVCHYCSLVIPPPTQCRFCRDPRTTRVEFDENGELVARASQVDRVGSLVYRGSGTERTVEELLELFPDARLLRMDRDTVEEKGAYRKILGDMRAGRADILVGTQMIAKGHDLPGVTLVGIIDADVGLHLPDFRASERAYQLITQAAGRAGRGEEPGRVLVQTRQPNHPTIVAAKVGRFKAFARFELDQRRELGYPPWGRLLRLIISSNDRENAMRAAEAVKTRVTELIPELEILIRTEIPSESDEAKNTKTLRSSVLGPSIAPHEKLAGRYRWHIIVKSNSAKFISTLARELNRWKHTAKFLGEFRLAVDVDPVEML